jgi:quercetin dioxygenase-like cupin family protein
MARAIAQATRWLRLPPAFDVERLRADLGIATAWHWQAHYSARAHRGSWTSIALRSASGEASDIQAWEGADFRDSALLARCAYFREVVDSFACEKKAVRLMALAPGAEIMPHRDHGGALEDGLARLHIPIVTAPRVVFTLDGEEVHFSAGATWYMNANCLHAVRNGSARERVHLVLDCVANAWLLALFEGSGWRPTPPPKYGDPNIDDANVGAVIAALRSSGNPDAEALAAQLETASSDRYGKPVTMLG